MFKGVSSFWVFHRVKMKDFLPSILLLPPPPPHLNLVFKKVEIKIVEDKCHFTIQWSSAKRQYTFIYCFISSVSKIADIFSGAVFLKLLLPICTFVVVFRGVLRCFSKSLCC